VATPPVAAGLYGCGKRSHAVVGCGGEDFATALGMARKWIAEVAWKIEPTTALGNSPEGNSSALRLPGRSSLGRPCCWQMNYRRFGRAECLGCVRVAGTIAPHAQVDVADRDAQPVARRAM